MQIRFAIQADLNQLLEHDKHIRESELHSAIGMKRVLIAEFDKQFIGWLRWTLFWDTTPFLNMLFLLERYRNQGYGKKLMEYWEKLMSDEHYEMVMTSTLSAENAQHFYRKLGYKDAGALLFPNESLEIIFIKNTKQC